MRKSRDGIFTYFKINDVKRILAEQYSGKKDSSDLKRKLLVHVSPCNYGTPGCVFFALNGSPPKGFAIYFPCVLVVIDPWGNIKNYLDYVLETDSGHSLYKMENAARYLTEIEGEH